MKVTFLCHSCFLVELETCSLLFDWYTGPIPEIDRSKPLYVFASHHHGDHYIHQNISPHPRLRIFVGDVALALIALLRPKL